MPRWNAMEGVVGIISLGVDYRNLISLHFSFCLWFSFQGGKREKLATGKREKLATSNLFF